MPNVETAHDLSDVSSVLTDVAIDVTIKEKLMTIIEHLQDQTERIADLHIQIGDLEAAGTCTGTVHWRDRDRPNYQPKLYAIHGAGDSCPMHGAPRPGKRLRAYIGTDPEKQDCVLDAIERQKQKAHLESQIRQIEVRLRRVKHALDDTWRAATGAQRWGW